MTKNILYKSFGDRKTFVGGTEGQYVINLFHLLYEKEQVLNGAKGAFAGIQASKGKKAAVVDPQLFILNQAQNKLTQVAVPETGAFTHLKRKQQELLIAFKDTIGKYENLKQKDILVQYVQEFEALEAKVAQVKGENIRNFNLFYTNAAGFLQQVIEPLQALQKSIQDMQHNTPLDSTLSSRIQQTIDDALQIYDTRLGLENVKTKFRARGFSDEDLGNIFSQFGGFNKK